jgi:hypothetical protein
MISYAVLLVPRDHRNAGYRFLVFDPKADRQTYNMTLVEKSDDNGSSNFFIRAVPINKFFSEDSKRKFHVHVPECVLMIDSAEQEYEADLYFWLNGSYQHQSTDD